jgi:predicted O-linked N-acetylglucosamine transferase (SPINDLY family)
MAQVTIQQAFELAQHHHQAGRLTEAEQLYRQVLALQPDHVGALHYLAATAHQHGQNDVALDLIRQVLALRPDYPDAHGLLGLVFRAQGQLPEAAAEQRTAIALDPNYAEAYSNLGNALRDNGQFHEAIAACRQAIALRPSFAEAYINLGNALRDSGRFEEAAAAYRQAIALRPNYAEAYINLGNALRDSGRFEEAVVAYRQAIALRPNHAEAHYDLGNALRSNGQLDVAIAAYRRAIALRPNYAEAHSNLGNALREAGQPAEATAACRRAIAINPHYAPAYSNLGNALANTGQLDDAVVAYRQAIALKPDYAEAHNNLGVALRNKGELDQATAAIRQAIALSSSYAEAHSNLGSVLKDQGELDDAVAACRRAIALKPDFVQAHSNLVYMLHFHPAYDARAMYEEASRWNQRHAAPLACAVRRHDNDRRPERPLRIGYVSADFRAHPMGSNFMPLALSHDQRLYRMVCYSSVRRPDAVTQRLRSLSSEWRDTAQLSDKQLAELIRRDKIDILVDLGMHMAGSRLLVFARRPAPVQVTCLCSMGTTGLPSIDYRISDPYSDPPGANDAYYAEQTVRLPDCYFCHEVPRHSPPVNVLPALETGHITFGCLNSFCKVTPEVLALWSQILSDVPNSRLILRCPSDSAQARVRSIMAARNVAADRIEFLEGRLPTDDYLRAHHRMDIYLDPFPYAGHTTSLDALWMGVPLITLAGRTDVGRSGIFLLTNLNMQELIAQTKQDYALKSAALANDLPRLAGYRGALRQRMLQSPLLDTPRFARNIEAAYRQMWRDWCATTPSG